jgi:formyltetrahydrofolate deformylase
MEFALLPNGSLDAFSDTFGSAVAQPFRMQWRLWDSARRKRLAILVSRYDHCLLDLLWRWQRDELGADVVLVASNHPDLRSVVEGFGLPISTCPSRRHDLTQAEGFSFDGRRRPGVRGGEAWR